LGLATPDISRTRSIRSDSVLHSLDVAVLRLRSCALIQDEFTFAETRSKGNGGSFRACHAGHILYSVYFA
jgi:hypothetical protein